MKAFSPQNFHAGVKKCHFGNFLEWARMAVPVIMAIKNPSQELKKNLFVLDSYDSLERLEGKTGEVPFFKVQSCKITV